VRRVRVVSGALLLAVAAMLALGARGAEGATLTQVGWWWRANDAALGGSVPAPPTVPEGGLVVAGAPDGATAIAALHFELDDGEGSPVLTLAVAENGDQGGATAVLAACITGSAWQPEHGGMWTSKPFPACDTGSVTGVRSEDGASWSFALAPLVSDGVLDVTLVPGVDETLPAGANGSTFQLVFAPPTAGSLVTTAGPDGSPPISLPDFGAPVAADGGGGFDAPATGGGLALPPVGGSAAFTPALPEAEQGLTATAPVAQERNAPLAASPVAAVEDNRLLSVAILSICGAALMWSARLSTPAPRRLGHF